MLTASHPRIPHRPLHSKRKHRLRSSYFPHIASSCTRSPAAPPRRNLFRLALLTKRLSALSRPTLFSFFPFLLPPTALSICFSTLVFAFYVACQTRLNSYSGCSLLHTYYFWLAFDPFASPHHPTWASPYRPAAPCTLQTARGFVPLRPLTGCQRAFAA